MSRPLRLAFVVSFALAAGTFTSAQRAPRARDLGVPFQGTPGALNGSGDIFLAFSTANRGAAGRAGVKSIAMLSNDEIDPLFDATVDATEEAIINALVAARTMTGVNGNTIYALPHDQLCTALQKYGRLNAR